MARLDEQRKKDLEPERMAYAIERLMEKGVEPFIIDGREIQFTWKYEIVKLFVYTGWHTGKSIKDGRGIEKLLNQLK